MGKFEPSRRGADWTMAGACTVAAEARAPGFEASLDPGSWLVLTRAASWTGNWFACHTAADDTVAIAARYLDRIFALETTAVGWVAQPLVESLLPLIADRSVIRRGTMPMMLREGRPLDHQPRRYPGTVTRVSDESALIAALEVMAQAFEVAPAELHENFPATLDQPAMTLHVASQAGRTDSMCLAWRTGDTSYIYVMATAPDRQRQGAGRAVLTQMMNDAVDAGVERFVLLASSAGEPLYRSLGYETVESPEFWIVNPPV